MTSSRKKPGAAFWATVVMVVALVAYPLSFGPACWLVSRPLTSGFGFDGRGRIPIVYWPICAGARNSSGTLAQAVNWYAKVGMPPDSFIWMPKDSSGAAWDINLNVQGGYTIRVRPTRGP